MFFFFVGAKPRKQKKKSGLWDDPRVVLLSTNIIAENMCQAALARYA